MQFQLTSRAANSQRTNCLMLPVYSDGHLSAALKSADRATDGALTAAIEAGDLRGALGDTLLIRPAHDVPFECVLLVGCGKRESFDRDKLSKALRAGLAAWRKTRLKSAVCALTAEALRGADAYRRARIAVEIWHDLDYRFTAMKSGGGDDSPRAQERLSLLVRNSDTAKARRGLQHGDAIGAGMSLSRELGNLPANVCTPSYLAKQARDLGRGNKQLRIEVLDEAAMRKLGMGSLLSVTAGSDEPAKFVILNYRGTKSGAAPVVLVGKGITFDTGGISLKPPPQMDEMKYDMCGAATVLGVMRAATELQIRQNIIGLIPTCENMPGGSATKPGDIVTAMSGKTIEILNTDAEGRLILADALTYARRFKPAAVIDIATLTGACIVALGRHRSGLLGNDDALANALLKAGDDAGDPAWRLPIDEAYQRLLRSNFADLANIGGRDAGTITAACFLSRFTEDMAWAHLDIAGTAWKQGAAKGSTGRPVQLLVEYLLNRFS